MPQISIVLPTFNGEAYLAESIESILSQTFEDFELIIVNDCSTDRTAEIIEQYVKKDSRVKSIYNDVNQRLPKSLNIGFENASGKYYSWTSDDNIYKPQALECMYAVLERRNNVGLVYCDCEQIDETGKVIGQHLTAMPNELYKGTTVGACFLYRSDIAKKVGGYDPDLFLVEDYDYWIRIAKYAELFYYPDTMYQCRKHPGSLTATRQKEIRYRTSKLWLMHIEQLLAMIPSYKEKKVFFYCILDGLPDEEQKQAEKIIGKYSFRYSLYLKQKAILKIAKYWKRKVIR